MAKQPFFMRFVEETPNTAAPVRTNVTAGTEGGDDTPAKERKPWEKGYETFKYPSDADEPVAEW